MNEEKKPIKVMPSKIKHLNRLNRIKKNDSTSDDEVSKSAHKVGKLTKKSKAGETRSEYIVYHKLNSNQLMLDCDVVFGEFYRLLLGVKHAPKVRKVFNPETQEVIGSYSKDVGGLNELINIDTDDSDFSKDFIDNGGVEVLFTAHFLEEEDLHKKNIGKNNEGLWVKIDNDRSGYSEFYNEQGKRLERFGRLKSSEKEQFFPLTSKYLLGAEAELDKTKSHFTPFKFRSLSGFIHKHITGEKKAYTKKETKLFREMSRKAEYIKHTTKIAFKTAIIPPNLFQLVAKSHTNNDERFVNFVTDRRNLLKHSLITSPEISQLIINNFDSYLKSSLAELDEYIEDYFGKNKAKLPFYQSARQFFLDTTSLQADILKIQCIHCLDQANIIDEWKKQDSSKADQSVFKNLFESFATNDLSLILTSLDSILEQKGLGTQQLEQCKNLRILLLKCEKKDRETLLPLYSHMEHMEKQMEKINNDVLCNLTIKKEIIEFAEKNNSTQLHFKLEAIRSQLSETAETPIISLINITTELVYDISITGRDNLLEKLFVALDKILTTEELTQITKQLLEIKQFTDNRKAQITLGKAIDTVFPDNQTLKQLCPVNNEEEQELESPELSQQIEKIEITVPYEVEIPKEIQDHIDQITSFSREIQQLSTKKEQFGGYISLLNHKLTDSQNEKLLQELTAPITKLWTKSIPNPWLEEIISLERLKEDLSLLYSNLMHDHYELAKLIQSGINDGLIQGGLGYGKMYRNLEKIKTAIAWTLDLQQQLNKQGFSELQQQKQQLQEYIKAGNHTKKNFQSRINDDSFNEQLSILHKNSVLKVLPDYLTQIQEVIDLSLDQTTQLKFFANTINEEISATQLDEILEKINTCDSIEELEKLEHDLNLLTTDLDVYSISFSQFDNDYNKLISLIMRFEAAYKEANASGIDTIEFKKQYDTAKTKLGKLRAISMRGISQAEECKEQGYGCLLETDELVERSKTIKSKLIEKQQQLNNEKEELATLKEEGGKITELLSLSIEYEEIEVDLNYYVDTVNKCNEHIINVTQTIEELQSGNADQQDIEQAIQVLERLQQTKQEFTFNVDNSTNQLKQLRETTNVDLLIPGHFIDKLHLLNGYADDLATKNFDVYQNILSLITVAQEEVVLRNKQIEQANQFLKDTSGLDNIEIQQQRETLITLLESAEKQVNNLQSDIDYITVTELPQIRQSLITNIQAQTEQTINDFSETDYILTEYEKATDKSGEISSKNDINTKNLLDEITSLDLVITQRTGRQSTFAYFLSAMHAIEEEVTRLETQRDYLRSLQEDFYTAVVEETIQRLKKYHNRYSILLQEENKQIEQLQQTQKEEVNQFLQLTEEQVGGLEATVEPLMQQALQLVNYYNFNKDSGLLASQEWETTAKALNEQLQVIDEAINKAELLSRLKLSSFDLKESNTITELLNKPLKKLHAYKEQLSAFSFIFSEDSSYHKILLQAKEDISNCNFNIDYFYELLANPLARDYLFNMPGGVELYQQLHLAHVKSFADNLKNISIQLITSIPPHEFLDYHHDKSEHKMRAIEFANKLSQYVCSNILNHTLISARTIVFEKWIWIAAACFENHDYNSFLTIMSALESSAIHRLNFTKNGLSRIAKEQLAKLSEYKKIAGGNLHQELNRRTGIEEDAIPYLGDYLTIVTFSHEGNSEKKMSELEPVKNVVDLFKQKKQRYENHTTPSSTEQLYNQINSIKYDKNRSYNRSLEFEPRKVELESFTAFEDQRFSNILKPIDLQDISKLKIEKSESILVLLKNTTLRKIIISNNLPLNQKVDHSIIDEINSATVTEMSPRDFKQHLSSIGVVLNKSQLHAVQQENTQMRYRGMIVNPELLDIIIQQDLIIKPRTHLFRTTYPEAVIQKLNNTILQGTSMSEYNSMLTEIGITLDDNSLKKVLQENINLSKKINQYVSNQTSEKCFAIIEYIKQNPGKALGALLVGGAIGTALPVVLSVGAGLALTGLAAQIGIGVGALAGAYTGFKEVTDEEQPTKTKNKHKISDKKPAFFGKTSVQKQINTTLTLAPIMREADNLLKKIQSGQNIDLDFVKSAEKLLTHAKNNITLQSQEELSSSLIQTYNTDKKMPDNFVTFLVWHKKMLNSYKDTAQKSINAINEVLQLNKNSIEYQKVLTYIPPKYANKEDFLNERLDHLQKEKLDIESSIDAIDKIFKTLISTSVGKRVLSVIEREASGKLVDMEDKFEHSFVYGGKLRSVLDSGLTNADRTYTSLLFTYLAKAVQNQVEDLSQRAIHKL